LRAYVDTSALAKWYVAEPGSEAFEAFVRGSDAVVISRLTVVEMRCLLARRRRARTIDGRTEAGAWSLFLEDVTGGALAVEPMPDARFPEALALIQQLPDLPLRTLDALHLATARAADATTVATADDVMRRAAEALGMNVAFFGGEAPPTG
jgi:uncharacterized protein